MQQTKTIISLLKIIQKNLFFEMKMSMHWFWKILYFENNLIFFLLFCCRERERGNKTQNEDTDRHKMPTQNLLIFYLRIHWKWNI